MSVNNQVLIRDVDRLDISQRAKKAAKELVNLIDMPVVFDLDARGNKSIAGRMPGKHNQYWVTVVNRVDKTEQERIILAHLFRGITETLRFPSLNFNSEFYQRLIERNDKTIIKSYRTIISYINSFVSTIVCELFLIPYEVSTTIKTRYKKQYWLLNRLKKFAADKKLLNRIRRSSNSYIELVLESANQSRVSEKFEMEIQCTIKNAYPYQASQLLIKDILAIKQSIQEVISKFTQETSATCMLELYNVVIETFKLHEKMTIIYPFAFRVNEKEELEKAEITEALSFVPEDVGDSDFYLKCIRYVNSAIVNTQEYYHYVLEEELPDVHVYLGIGEKSNAYACTKKPYENTIIITDTLFRKVKEYADDCEVDNTVINGYCFADDYRERRLKVSLFLIALHEYAHIKNGDCGSYLHQDIEQEKLADRFALEMIDTIILFQYRPGNSPFDYNTVKSYVQTQFEISLVPECWKFVTRLRQ